MNMCSRCSSTTPSRTASRVARTSRCVLRATAPFVYVRLHGPDAHHLYAGSYPLEDLQWWADRLHEWDAAGTDVFVYFNNDGHGHAVRNALALRQLLNC